MQLECSVWLQSTGGNSINRKAQGVLSLGRQKNKASSSREENNIEEGKCVHFLLISTRSNNHPGKLELNKIRTICRKMEKQGKASIQFGEPELSVFISDAKPDRLHTFLAHLESTRRGEPLKQVQSVKAAQQGSALAIGNRRSKMVIKSSAEYPRSSGEGFPSSLQFLQMNRIGLHAVDSRWFNLHSLRQLWLDDNKLGRNWTAASWRRFCAISRLEQLSDLDLRDNPLHVIPDFFLGSLPQSLTVLTLAGCNLRRLSNQIGRLQNLMMLDLSMNPMEELPEDLCLLPRLRKLHLAFMPKLRFLPASMFYSSARFNHFTELNVSNNTHAPFACLEPPTGNAQVEKLVPPLCRLAAAALLNNRQHTPASGVRCLLPSTNDFLPKLLRRHLDEQLLRCYICRHLYAPSSPAERFQRVQLRMFVSSTLIGPSPAYIRVQLCPICQEFETRRNPFAHIRL